MDPDEYVNPAFNFDEAEHEEVLAAAANIDAVLKGEKGDDVRTTSPYRRVVATSTRECLIAGMSLPWFPRIGTQGWLVATSCPHHVSRSV